MILVDGSGALPYTRFMNKNIFLEAVLGGRVSRYRPRGKPALGHTYYTWTTGVCLDPEASLVDLPPWCPPWFYVWLNWANLACGPHSLPRFTRQLAEVAPRLPLLEARFATLDARFRSVVLTEGSGRTQSRACSAADVLVLLRLEHPELASGESLPPEPRLPKSAFRAARIIARRPGAAFWERHHVTYFRYLERCPEARRHYCKTYVDRVLEASFAILEQEVRDVSEPANRPAVDDQVT